MKKRTFSVLGLSIVMFLLVLNPVQGQSYYGAISANVETAFYADIDQQHDIFDIQYKIAVMINDFLSMDYYYGYDLKLYVGLELPSGTEWWYQIDLLAFVDQFTMQMVFYDSATESGLYTAHVYAYSVYNNELTYYDQLIFDPPGAGVGGGSPPSVAISFY